MFPIELVTRPLLATCPERVCERCGEPWQCHRAKRSRHLTALGALRPRCSCAADFRPGLVLDPFIGAGTVAVAAEQHGRDWLGVEINEEYAALAEARTAADRSGASTGLELRLELT
jgi:hypothetical protein